MTCLQRCCRTFAFWVSLVACSAQAFAQQGGALKVIKWMANIMVRRRLMAFSPTVHSTWPRKMADLPRAPFLEDFSKRSACR